ncbi:substrate-binding domain-containing protein [Ilumatobacter nonamiensis]|uniref:substrate-binding domain-containing protein n=1 Tax=Ilumatobacter nonamiensis TaxID=467093 RepID=UPI0003457EA6|nr:substrate-binding domain-containing protein [Ilumatobacter nonamiensis]
MVAACGSDDDSSSDEAETEASAAVEDAESAVTEAEEAAETETSEAMEEAETETSEAMEEAETETSEAMEDEGSEETADLSSLSGDITISGSSTVEPVSVRVQELFNEQAPDVNITVDGPGTGDGFVLFCEGSTDISDASRAIKDEEAAACEEAGIEFTELQVGIDGLAVITNSANDAVECLSFEQIYAMVGPESTGITNWSDANELAVEVGGEGDLPDAELEIYGPGEESGTFDSFIEIVLEGIAEEREQEAITRPDYNPSADDNVILQGIQGADTSLGWVGYAFADTAENVKLLEVDGGEGCVAADPDTIASNEYPVSRPLFIYVNNATAAENPQLEAFVDFYMAEGLDTAVAEVDYVALSDDAKAEVRAAWDSAL